MNLKDIPSFISTTHLTTKGLHGYFETESLKNIL